MKYYLTLSQMHEVSARMEYLYKVFHTFFVRIPNIQDFLCFTSFPHINDDICLITGHTGSVMQLLAYGVEEKIVVLNTCYPKYFRRFIDKNKNIYFCKTDDLGAARLRSGTNYNIGFDVLDSELLLSISQESESIEKIKNSYDLLRRQ